MVGTDLPYFPIGGPVPNLPKELSKSANTWGGMEIGGDQMYASQVVDGHVSEIGGHALKIALEALPLVDEKTKFRCLTGDAVVTTATEGLRHNFMYIIHTVPPFYKDQNMERLLKKCYTSSLDMAVRNDMKSLACPLLGTGARGIPHDIAVNEAIEALTNYSKLERPMVFKFGLIDDWLVQLLEDSFARRSEQWERL